MGNALQEVCACDSVWGVNMRWGVGILGLAVLLFLLLLFLGNRISLLWLFLGFPGLL